jgi:aconitate hydratase
MIFDFEMINAFYRELPSRVSDIRKNLKRPLTLSEKILYSHLYQKSQSVSYNRGVDYVDFEPDRVAMQDATAHN